LSIRKHRRTLISEARKFSNFCAPENGFLVKPLIASTNNLDFFHTGI
jgi:hypothetical protein